ncbi:MAG: hypothetical protein GX660_23150 [Clostridiaceae bacterium]|nr:hypothetical protein [Clostridiaceae bacterium]
MKKMCCYSIVVLNFIFSFLFFTSVVLAADVAPLPDPKDSAIGVIISTAILAVILILVIFLVWKPGNNKNNDKNDKNNNVS